MKILLFFTIAILTFYHCHGQVKPDARNNIVTFDTLIARFKEYNYNNDSIRLPLIYKGDDYKVVLSDHPIFVNIIDTALKNPYSRKYPLSYSIIFHDNLVALFEPGNFVCYKIPSLQRNFALESKLNTKKFQYHWLLNNKLVAQYNNQTYVLNKDLNWEIYKEINPLKNQPKLFEDARYIIFFDCHGEWGGTVYFFNKSTQKTYFTEATCANTITKKDGKYFVLSKVGHMSGSSKLKVIEHPDKLTFVDLNKVGQPYKGQALGYADRSKQAKTIFDFYGILLFSSFSFGNKIIYLVNWRERTFLAEITDSTISIVNPLFNDELYTHVAVTTSYDNRTLINLDFSGIAAEREVSSIIVEGNKIIRIDWNEKHNR